MVSNLHVKDITKAFNYTNLLISTSHFRNLYVHGFVVDEQGKKMSKSIGNVLSPSHVVSGCSDRSMPAYGADVLR